MLDEILDLFGSKKSRGQPHSQNRDSDRREYDDDRYERRRDDDDDSDGRRDSYGNPSKKQRFADLLEMD